MWIDTTAFKIWVKGCQQLGTNIWGIDICDNATGLYATSTKYMYQNSYYNNSPVYHIWIHGKRYISTTNYREACDIWEQKKKELKNEKRIEK